MTRPVRAIAPPAVCALLAWALLAGGCSAAQPPTSPQTAENPPPALSAPQPEPIQAMSPEMKRDTMAEDFPIEVPVPQGEVTRAVTQGGGIWDYEIEVAASPDALADWFANTYTGRSWTVVGQGSLTEGSGGLYLELRKGAAESRVEVLNATGDGPTVARVTVGVGTPVLGTY